MAKTTKSDEAITPSDAAGMSDHTPIPSRGLLAASVYRFTLEEFADAVLRSPKHGMAHAYSLAELARQLLKDA